MSQPESRFIIKVNTRALNKGTIHIEKMEGSRNCPDYYYEGNKGVLWVEYKVHPNKPSKLQELWIARARSNGIPCWVATELPNGRIKLETKGGEDKNFLDRDDFIELIRETVYESK